MNRDERYSDFEQALVDVRVEKKLTQMDVANHLSKPQSYVSKYESGERRLDVIEFLEICDALSIEPNTILRRIRPKHV